MNKNMKIGVGALVLLAAIGVAWAMTGGDDSASSGSSRDNARAQNSSRDDGAREVEEVVERDAGTGLEDTERIQAPAAAANAEDEDLTASKKDKKKRRRRRSTPRKAAEVEEPEYNDDFQKKKKKAPKFAR